jgi:hypothetical protein
MTMNGHQTAISGIRSAQAASALGRWLRCASLGVVLVSLLELAAAGEEKPAANDGLLTASGRVLLPDGSPAAGATVWALGGDQSKGIALVHTNEKGEFRLRHAFDIGASLNARTEDGRLLASLHVAREQARTTFARPVELRLAPGREQVVSVTFQDKPLAGATVVASDTANFKATAQSDGHGQARLRMPAGEKLRNVVAWHPSFGAGGKMFGPQDEEPPASGPLALTIVPAQPYRIRVVDGQGQPVPDLELAVSCNAITWIVTADVDAAHLRTDARGEALVSWMPRDPKFVNVNILDPRWKLDRSDTEKGQTVVTALRKYPVRGRLVMSSGVNPEGIVVAGTGFGANLGMGAFHVDLATTRARRDGSFTFWVVPDHGYSVGVVDSEWASDRWTGVILAEATATPGEIRLSAQPAVKLSVHVTRGPQHQGVANTWITLRSAKSFSWQDARGQHHNAGGGPQYAATTDENGTAHFAVGKGEYELFMISGKWIEQRKIDVSSDQPMAVAIDRPWTDKRTISGGLTLQGKPHRRGPATVVRAWSPKRPEIGGEGIVQPDGRFSLGIDADDAYLFAVDTRERLSAAATVGPAQSTIDLDLLPMGSASGVVADAQGKPLGGRPVELLFKGPGFMDMIVIDSTLSDEQGRFHFDAVPSQLPLSICSGEPASARSARLTQRTNEFHIDANVELYLDAKENRTDIRLAIDPRLSARLIPARTAAVPLDVRLKQLTRDARLAGMRVLIILHGDSSNDVIRLSTQIVESEDLPVLHFLTLRLSPEDMKREAPFLARMGWERPWPGEIELVVLGGTGVKLAERRIVAHDAAARLRGAEFIRQNLPPRRDARAALSAAQDDARDTGRRLVIVEAGPRCRPCFQLARWMDDQHSLLAKDYVIVKVLEDLDDHARDVIGKFNPPRGAGIPWFAITEPDGKILATSDGPLGNTGFPSGTEAKKHFKKMLELTARHLTPAERERLLGSLPND